MTEISGTELLGEIERILQSQIKVFIQMPKGKLGLDDGFRHGVIDKLLLISRHISEPSERQFQETRALANAAIRHMGNYLANHLAETPERTIEITGGKTDDVTLVTTAISVIRKPTEKKDTIDAVRKFSAVANLCMDVAPVLRKIVEFANAELAKYPAVAAR